MTWNDEPLMVPDDETSEERTLRAMTVEVRREQRHAGERVHVLNLEIAQLEKRAQALRAAYAKLTEGRT